MLDIMHSLVTDSGLHTCRHELCYSSALLVCHLFLYNFIGKWSHLFCVAFYFCFPSPWTSFWPRFLAYIAYKISLHSLPGFLQVLSTLTVSIASLLRRARLSSQEQTAMLWLEPGSSEKGVSMGLCGYRGPHSWIQSC